MNTNRIRRPARLDPQEANELPALGDAELRDELAAASARIVVLGDRVSVDTEVAERVSALIKSEGIDSLAALWADAPSSTLAGVLWRLYELRQEALRAGSITDGPLAVADAILSGKFDGDLAEALEQISTYVGDGQGDASVAEEFDYAARLWRRGQLA